MYLRNIKLIVWHKTERAKYKVLAIDWNSATVEVIKLEGEDPKAMERISFEPIDNVTLVGIRFND